MNILFFGSTPDSLLVLQALNALRDHAVCAVVTQPPRPVGRDQIIRATPVEIWAKQHGITTLSFPSNQEKSWMYANEDAVIDTLAPFGADLLVSASYGQKIPTKTIRDAAFGGLNVHPSLLPRWRGADPVPWAILTGDHQTGVSVITLSDHFDEGEIIAQKKLSITPNDTSDPLRTRLFEMGTRLLIDTLPLYLTGKMKGIPQHASETPYARRLTRDDGYEPWSAIENAQSDAKEAARMDRKFRALTPWPGLWTKLSNPPKRLKILECALRGETWTITKVQLEGKNPVTYEEFARAYLAAEKKT